MRQTFYKKLRSFKIHLILFSLIGGISATSIGAVIDAERLHLTNMESNDKLWALLQYESQYGRIEYNSFRRFGDYSKTYLRAVKAVGFHLSGFDFANADLRGADFRQADLRGADFRGADLRETVFLSANVKGAMFNAETKLPFPREDAIKRGWREVKR